MERAKKHGIDSTCIRKKEFESDALYEEALIQHMTSKSVDLVIMAGFMVVIGDKFIHAFENRIMNVHPSLIPSFCGNGFYGLNVHEAVLAKGVKVTGATVHFVTEETDAGPIIMQKAVSVKEETLQKHCKEGDGEG